MCPWRHTQTFAVFQSRMERRPCGDAGAMVRNPTWLSPQRFVSSIKRKTPGTKRAAVYSGVLLRETLFTTRAGAQPAPYASVRVWRKRQVRPHYMKEESVHKKVHEAKQEGSVSHKRTPLEALLDRFRQ